MRDLALPATVGALLVVPLMVLEWATSTGAPRTDFSVLLFGAMWLVAGLCVRLFLDALRTGHSIATGQVAVSRSIPLLPRIAIMGWLAWGWASMFIDQWPCFLGASGC